jgi:hypothetical protein
MTLAVLLAVIAVALLLLDIRRQQFGYRPSRLLAVTACAFIVFAMAVGFTTEAAGRVIP